MATNQYFKNKVRSEQQLYEDLVIEALQMYGQDVYYIPREIVNKDRIFLDDVPSRFSNAYKIEMYIENTEGFEGEGDLMSKFGIEVRDQATFIISLRSWERFISLDSNLATGLRPNEGDLIYFPLSGSMFEIKFVEHENPFYQVGKLFVFKLQCELFEYSGEDFDTGNINIDLIEDQQAYQIGVTLASSYTGGDGNYVANENITTVIDSVTTTVGEVVSWTPSTRKLMIKDNTRTLQVGDTITGANGTAREITSIDDVMEMSNDPQADNKDFETKADNYLDFSETNPFGEVT